MTGLERIVGGIGFLLEWRRVSRCAVGQARRSTAKNTSPIVHVSNIYTTDG